MKNLCIAVAVLLVVCSVSAFDVISAPIPPHFSNVSNSTLEWKNLITGEFLRFRDFYDYNLQKYRVDYPDTGVSKFQHYDKGIEYLVIHESCIIKKLKGTLPMSEVAPGSTYLGQDSIRGVNCDHWQFPTTTRNGAEFWDDPRGPTPMREVDSALMFKVQIDWMEYQPRDSLDPSVFLPPPDILKNCHE